MNELANRVSARTPLETETSASALPPVCLATRSSTCAASSAVTVSTLRSRLRGLQAHSWRSSGHSDPDAPEPGGHRRMAGVADLHRLALPAVRRAPADEVVAEHVQRSPEPGRDPGVGGVAKHPATRAVL